MDPTIAVAVTALLLVGALAGAMFWEAYRCRRLVSTSGPRPEPPQEQVASTEYSAPEYAAPESLEDVTASHMRYMLDQLSQLQERVAVNNALIQGSLGDISLRQEELSRSSAQLLNALSNSQVRGHWGELQLRRVVEAAGMLEHVDFNEQVQLDGGRLRPDMVVRLPGQRCVVVDSKAPMEAYMTATAAETDRDRQEFLDEFLRAIKRHLNSLSGKAYWQQLEDSPEFVVMFLPSEAVLATALQLEPALFESAASKRVIMATPATLLALLYTVGYDWKQVQQASNMREITDLALEMYDRTVAMAENLRDAGQILADASKSYNTAMFHLDKRVLVSGRKLQQLAGHNRRLPEFSSEYPINDT